MAPRMTDFQMLKALESFNKPYFTLADVEKILGQSRETIRVTLHRLVKRAVVTRLTSGVFQLASQSEFLPQAANQLYYPSYLSFESALAHYGILSQRPYTLTFATTKRSKRLILGGIEVQYHQLKEEYFSGYIIRDNLAIAEPEKAIADELYLMTKGYAALEPAEWSFVNLDKNRLRFFTQMFPKAVQQAAKDITWSRSTYNVSIDRQPYIGR